MNTTIEPTGTLIETYNQGESVITIYQDGDYEQAYKDGIWCHSYLTLEAQMRIEDEIRELEAAEA